MRSGPASCSWSMPTTAVRCGPLGHLPGRVPAAGVRCRRRWRRCSCPGAAGWSAASWSTGRSTCRASGTRTTRPMCSGPNAARCRPAMLARCDHVVRIPTRFCINLAVAGAVVMYDRVQSLGRFAPRPLHVGGPASSCRRMCTVPSSASAGGRRPMSSRREVSAGRARRRQGPSARRGEPLWSSGPAHDPRSGKDTDATLAALGADIRDAGDGLGPVGFGADAQIRSATTGTGRSTRSPTVVAASAIWRASRPTRPATIPGVTTRRCWSCACPARPASMQRCTPAIPTARTARSR